MDIKEAKQEIIKLENLILKKLIDFENNFDMSITDINLTDYNMTTISGESSHCLGNIKITVKLF